MKSVRFSDVFRRNGIMEGWNDGMMGWKIVPGYRLRGPEGAKRLSN